MTIQNQENYGFAQFPGTAAPFSDSPFHTPTATLSCGGCARWGRILKKLSERHFEHLIRKARWGNLPRFIGEAKELRAAQKRDAKNRAQQEFNKVRGLLPNPIERSVADSRLMITDPPQQFDLQSNYEETLSFLLELRELHRPRRMGINRNQSNRWRRLINMARIEDIDPATGLVLAAELDSYRKNVKDLRSQDDTWHDNVHSFFLNSGLFDLLGVSPQRAHVKASSGPERQVIKYRKGAGPDGKQADELRAELEALCGEKFGPRIAVNNALCEAMTNSHHHAYPADKTWWPVTPQENWWATCAWTPSTGTMHMMIYDQGVGIPATLPRSRHWMSAVPILDRLDPERTDAGVIQAALELRRTSTDILGRGRGLFEMAEWIDKTESGFLRILSGRGRVTYRPGKVVQSTNLRAPFCGTLVEWEIQRGS